MLAEGKNGGQHQEDVIVEMEEKSSRNADGKNGGQHQEDVIVEIKNSPDQHEIHISNINLIGLTLVPPHVPHFLVARLPFLQQLLGLIKYVQSDLALVVVALVVVQLQCLAYFFRFTSLALLL